MALIKKLGGAKLSARAASPLFSKYAPIGAIKTSRNM